jgi:hypothetical protein
MAHGHRCGRKRALGNGLLHDGEGAREALLLVLELTLEGGQQRRG